MSIAYAQSQKQKIRITLEMEVFEDFDARNIDWQKLFDLEPNEQINAYIEEFDRY